MVLKTRSTKIRKFGFILTDQFSMIAFSAAIETLRMANDVAGETLYEWSILSTYGGIIKASSQMGFPTKAVTEIGTTRCRVRLWWYWYRKKLVEDVISMAKYHGKTSCHYRLYQYR